MENRIDKTVKIVVVATVAMCLAVGLMISKITKDNSDSRYKDVNDIIESAEYKVKYNGKLDSLLADVGLKCSKILDIKESHYTEYMADSLDNEIKNIKERISINEKYLTRLSALNIKDTQVHKTIDSLNVCLQQLLKERKEDDGKIKKEIQLFVITFLSDNNDIYMCEHTICNNKHEISYITTKEAMEKMTEELISEIQKINME